MADSEPEASTATEGDERSEVELLKAEVERLREQLTQAETSTRSRGWRRQWLSVTCAVLAAVLLPVAVFTVWARDTVLDTDEYVATVAPLADDEDIQEAVTFRVTEAIAEAADFKGIAEAALPADAQVLAGPIESGAKSLTGEVVNTVVASDEFAQLWQDAQRRAHENLVPLLKGEGNDLISTADGRVVLELGSVAQDALVRLDDRLGTELADEIPEEQLDAELVLVDSNELADAQGLVRFVDALSWFSVILALGFLAGAPLFAEQRRLGVRRLGLAIAVPMLLALVAYAWTRDQYLTGLPQDVHNPDAAAAMFDITTRFALRAFRALLVLGVLVSLGAWVVGPSTKAAKVRAWWDTLLGRTSESAAERQLGPVPSFVAANERALLGGAAALGLATLVLWTHPTGMVVLLILVITLVGLGAVRLLAEVGRRTDPPPIDEIDTATDDDAVINLHTPDPVEGPTNDTLERT